MIKESVTAQDVVDLLNEFIKLDPVGATNFLKNHISVNDKITDHPTIQVAPDGISPLGFLNGLFGVFDDGKHRGWGCIYVTENDEGFITGAGISPKEI